MLCGPPDIFGEDSMRNALRAAGWRPIDREKEYWWTNDNRITALSLPDAFKVYDRSRNRPLKKVAKRRKRK